MPKVLESWDKDQEKVYLIECPGCGHCHMFDKRWTFNGDFDKPTFRASMLSKYRHPKGYSNENPAPKGWVGEYVEEICHSFVTDGMIEYLSDCTHELAGKTIELPDFDKEDS